MQNTQVRSKGELLGELPFFFRLRHIYTAQVGKAASTLYVLSHDSYQQVCASYADDSVAVLEVITDTVEKAGVTKSQSSWNTSLTQVRLLRAMRLQACGAPGGCPCATAATQERDARTQDSGAIESAAKVKQTIDDAIKRLGERHIISFIESASQADVAAVKHALEAGSVQARVFPMPALSATRGEWSEQRPCVQVDAADYDLRTGLHLAASNGHVALVTLLLDKFDASHGVRDRYGGTPLDDAIRERHPDVVAALRDKCDCRVRAADYTERFIQAAADDDLGMLQMLAAAGMDPNCFDYDHRTALHVCVSEGRHRVLAYLLSLPAIELGPVDRIGNTPFWDALVMGDEAAAAMLAERGAPIQGTMAARICAEAGANNVLLLKTLVSNGVDIMLQARAARPLGVWFSKYTRTGLEGPGGFAQGDGHGRSLSMDGLRVQDERGRTPVHVAASCGCLETCALIVRECKGNLNVVDVFGNTALDDALMVGERAIAALLESNGALRGGDPALEGQHARTLAWAAEQEGVRRAARRQEILESLPESRLVDAADIVNDALDRFVVVRHHIPPWLGPVPGSHRVSGASTR